MRDTILLIVDNNDGKIFEKQGKNLSKELKGEILTLGFTNALYHEKNKALIDRYLPDHSFIDLCEYYQKAQKLTREYCLRLKMELPRRKIWKGKCLFDLYSLDNFNIWWFTTFSEMGSFRIKLIDQIYFISLIQLIIPSRAKYKSIYLDIKDHAFNSVLIKYFMQENISYSATKHRCSVKSIFIDQFPFVWWMTSITIFSFLQLIKNMILKSSNIGFKPTSDDFFLFFSFFPLLWKKIDSNDFKSALYDDLMNKLSQYELVYNSVFMASVGKTWKYRKSISNIFQNSKIIAIERFIRSKDYKQLLNLKLLKRVFIYSFLVSKNIRESYNGFDISKLVKGTLNSSLGDHELFRDILIFVAFSNIVEKYKIKGIIHSSEFQCYEKAIWYAAKDKSKTFAVQHSAIGKNWLNYYFCPDEITSYLKGNKPLWDMPLPNLYLISGFYPYEVMLQNNIPESILKVCGAIRYDKLAVYKQLQPSKCVLREKNNILLTTKVILAFSGVNRKESIDMINNISRVLKNIKYGNHDVMVIFKSHPLQMLDEEFKNIMRVNNKEILFDTIPIDANYFDYITLADATCFCNSTIGIESIALGTHAISFDNIHSFVSFDMIEVGNAVFHVKNSLEFSQALNKIMNNDTQLKRIEEYWPEAIKKTFYQLDGKSNQRFIDCLGLQKS